MSKSTTPYVIIMGLIAIVFVLSVILGNHRMTEHEKQFVEEANLQVVPFEYEGHGYLLFSRQNSNGSTSIAVLPAPQKDSVRACIPENSRQPLRNQITEIPELSKTQQIIQNINSLQ